MTAPAAPTKRTFTVEAAKQVRNLAKPAYVLNLERAAANGAVPFDNAGAGFPWDVPSEAFTHHLRKLDEAIAQAQHQLDQLRELSQSMRSVAEGKAASTDVEVDPPPPPEPQRVPAAVPSQWETLKAELNGTPASSEPDELIEPTIKAAPTPEPMTWTCPDHGLFAEAVSRKGRPYRYCPKPECGKLDIMGIPSNA